MSLIGELAFGTLVLTGCATIQVLAVAAAAALLGRLASRLSTTKVVCRSMVLLLVGLAMMVFGHSLQVWGWAAALLWVGAFTSIEAAIYFSTVTYTTLGYGDITLEEGLRVFVTFSAISGLISFGITSAFLVALIVRVLPNIGGRD